MKLSLTAEFVWFYNLLMWKLLENMPAIIVFIVGGCFFNPSL